MNYGCSNVYSLCLILFLTSLEISIVATSLVSMADDLNSFNNYSWVVTAYILTYTGERSPFRFAYKLLAVSLTIQCQHS